MDCGGTQASAWVLRAGGAALGDPPFAGGASRLGDRSGLWPGDVFPAPFVALLSAILRPGESEKEEVLLVFGWRFCGVVVVLPNRPGLRAGPGGAGLVSATTFQPGERLVV